MNVFVGTALMRTWDSPRFCGLLGPHISLHRSVQHQQQHAHFSASSPQSQSQSPSHILALPQGADCLLIFTSLVLRLRRMHAGCVTILKSQTQPHSACACAQKDARKQRHDCDQHKKGHLVMRGPARFRRPLLGKPARDKRRKLHPVAGSAGAYVSVQHECKV